MYSGRGVFVRVLTMESNLHIFVNQPVGFGRVGFSFFFPFFPLFLREAGLSFIVNLLSVYIKVFFLIAARPFGLAPRQKENDF